MNGSIQSLVVFPACFLPGLMLASEGGGKDFDLDIAAAANTEVIKAKLSAMKALGLGGDAIEDILITLSSQVHLIRPLAKTPTIFLYAALEKKANLGMARIKVKAVEQSLEF